ncbi:MAG: tyrosine-type recombinase/integrase [Sulfurimonas sp.]|jgi:integrase
MGLKPIKIQLSNNSASGMYILVTDDEIRYAKNGDIQPPNRAYKIQIGVEAVYAGKRHTGKRLFNIAKGTSISKAVGSLLGKREEMKETLRTKGTLKIEREILKPVSTKDRKFKSVYQSWINGKAISKRPATVKNYDGCYHGILYKLDNKIIEDIAEDDVQNLINEMINKGKKPKTIAILKVVLTQVLNLNDVHLNWKKIILPKIEKQEKFSGNDDEAKLIAKTLMEYKHPVARGVFTFLLSGRRIGETMLLEHKDINYTTNKFKLLAKNTKTNTEVDFDLTPALINAIKTQKTTAGKFFDMQAISIHYHFKKAMLSIGISDMVMHDLRSMVAVVSLRNGADIYSVSKMLAHKKLSTTEANYLGDGVERAKEAQDTFTALIGSVDEVIDVELEGSEFTALKNIYPNATDDKIQQIIEMMK